MKLKKLLIAASTACAVPFAALSAPITMIDGFTFDLAQFDGAFVTTDSTGFGSSTFDNAAGIDGFELGELAARPGGSTAPTDRGDRITLGNSTTQKSLTLNYGPGGISVGSGMASKFVVYEQASVQGQTDSEGTFYEIAFNGGLFSRASDGILSAVTVGTSNTQNQVVFDLLGLGLSIGDTIFSVTLRNILGSTDYSDPDMVFAARAGEIAPVPVPAAGFLLLGGLGALTLMRRRKKV